VNPLSLQPWLALLVASGRCCHFITVVALDDSDTV
jgi:hypothetical protein